MWKKFKKVIMRDTEEKKVGNRWSSKYLFYLFYLLLKCVPKCTFSGIKSQKLFSNKELERNDIIKNTSIFFRFFNRGLQKFKILALLENEKNGKSTFYIETFPCWIQIKIEEQDINLFYVLVTLSMNIYITLCFLILSVCEDYRNGPKIIK